MCIIVLHIKRPQRLRIVWPTGIGKEKRKLNDLYEY